MSNISKGEIDVDWIACSEAMPSDDDYYLIYSPYMDSGYPYMGFACYDPLRFGWIQEDLIGAERITHWANVPKPPQPTSATVPEPNV